MTIIIMKMFDVKDAREIPIFFKNLSQEELESKIKEIKRIKGTNITQISRIIRINRKIVKNAWEES